jgi:hypothetical protein
MGRQGILLVKMCLCRKQIGSTSDADRTASPTLRGGEEALCRRNFTWINTIIATNYAQKQSTNSFARLEPTYKYTATQHRHARISKASTSPLHANLSNRKKAESFTNGPSPADGPWVRTIVDKAQLGSRPNWRISRKSLIFPLLIPASPARCSPIRIISLETS